MPRPYSLDLRERAVARVMDGETVRSVASVLQISVVCVVKWSQRFRQTGSATPGPMHGHRPRLLLPHRDWLIARTANGQAFTLRGLRAELEERGVKVDYRTVWTFVHAEGLSFKKSVLPSEQDRPRITRKRALWKKHQGRSIPKGWCSSTRPGPRPTWSRCEGGHHAAKDWRPGCPMDTERP